LFTNSQPFGKKIQKTVVGDFFDSHCRQAGDKNVDEMHPIALHTQTSCLPTSNWWTSVDVKRRPSLRPWTTWLVGVAWCYAIHDISSLSDDQAFHPRRLASDAPTLVPMLQYRHWWGC